MNNYEVLYILSSKLDDAAKEAVIEKFSACVKEDGGEVSGVNKWGTKRLAYPINYANDGYYVLMSFSSKAEFIQELERRMRIDDAIMRFMVTRK